jgi:hypothetical protein
MLNSTSLANDLKEKFDDVLPDALEAALNSQSDYKSEDVEKKNKEFADMFTDMVSDPLAKRLAACIDAYIKSGQLSGTIITAGSPVTQTAVIVPAPMGMPTSGKVPNTLGIM